MPSSGPNNPSDPREPSAKCCLGVAYFNRTLERSGVPPKCLGYGQLKHGEQGNDDVRQLSGATSDFQYYCIGYSSHPAGSKPSRPGESTQMPYCEGVEIAITEELTAPASARMAEAAAVSSGRPLSRDRPAPGLDHGAAAPLPPAGPSDPSNPSSSDPSDSGDGSSGRGGLRERFRANLARNADSLLAAVTGERLPRLPVQLRSYDSVSEAGKALVDTASLNVAKMRLAADFIRFRTMDAVKLTIERLRNPEEETE
ncbi:hypothetical protein GPECTOR_620g712 [Gonium pectorale]|uniref:DUF8204 domain-containing protein n=1 Tax=Gonium pectorale TaxID=33097 RepID=A0A150FUG8_GONPE|nr:hypothetical protein GPECTOR_620g712 [Gonium pectorale]|eukprot:KXZ41239.1 hypothetical protein GPECTOR_620g712 [Gonium pectorale]